MTETSLVRVAETAVSIGAWAIPFCYRLECQHRVNKARTAAVDTERDKRIVRGIGDLALLARSEETPITPETVRSIARDVGAVIQHADYKGEYDPHSARLLEHVAPLHEEQ